MDLVTSTLKASVTFTTGIEAGGMEGMTVALVQSLRKWGGRFANCPFIVVQPRFGPPINKSILRQLDELGAQFIKAKPTHGMSWFVWMNKPTTLLEAERHSNDTTIAWLDADMLVMGEPDLLELNDNLDFAACAADKNAGTSGPDDPFEPYWRQIVRQFDLDIEKIPWVTTHREQQKIRLYFNAGLFAYRRSSGFGSQFMNRCKQLLNSRIASTTQGIVLTDQIALGLTALSMGLRWDDLPLTYNHAIGSKLHRAGLYDPSAWADLKILHYHDALWPAFRPTLIQDMSKVRPDVAEFIAGIPKLDENRPLHWKLLQKVCREMRKRKYKKHESACERF